MPITASAQVVITEFLYDADGTDTDKEYVEIFNAGSSSVDLTKWKINDGSNHTLNVPPKNGGTGSIVLAAGGYAILVDNATDFLALHSGLSGTVIDTVLSLNNTSGSISLLDDNGATAFSVTYTKDFGAAGDGNSLHASGSSWIATAPSPLTGTTQSETQGGTQTTTTTTGNNLDSQVVPPQLAPVSSYSRPPDPILFADAGADRVVIVGADTEFQGRAYNKERESVGNARLVWNFGDGVTKEGISVLHHFQYPGKYVVVLSVAHDIESASDRVVVLAEPARLGFSVLADGSVGVENKSGRELDLSRWVIHSFTRNFVLPEDTIVLADATVRISAKTLDFFAGPETYLAYPNGEKALGANEESFTAQGAESSVSEAPPPETVAVASRIDRETLPRAEKVAVEVAQPEPAEDLPSATSLVDVSQTAAVGSAFSGSYWWFIALIFSILCAGGVLVAKKYMSAEWDIIEEKE